MLLDISASLFVCHYALNEISVLQRPGKMLFCEFLKLGARSGGKSNLSEHSSDQYIVPRHPGRLKEFVLFVVSQRRRGA